MTEHSQPIAAYPQSTAVGPPPGRGTAWKWPSKATRVRALNVSELAKACPSPAIDLDAVARELDVPVMPSSRKVGGDHDE